MPFQYGDRNGRPASSIHPTFAFEDYSFPPLTLKVRATSFALLRPFSIARGTKITAEVILVEVSGCGHIGRGEAVPYPRYDETVADSIAAVSGLTEHLGDGLCHSSLMELLPAGAARNALDCALWDWRSRKEETSVARLIGLPLPEKTVTTFTISLGSPEQMAAHAAEAAHMPLLKLKLGDARLDADRMSAVRRAVPKARLIVDANEAWTIEDLERLAPVAKQHHVEMIEQPLPAEHDDVLRTFVSKVPLCADESFQGNRRLEDLAQCYQAVNLKLDKTGGLSAACTVAAKAIDLHLDLFVGCMVASSLAMVPALHLASFARWVDLDGPLLLAEDRRPGLRIDRGIISDIPQGLWGHV